VFDDPTNLVIDEPISAFVCSNFHRYLLLPTAAIRFPRNVTLVFGFDEFNSSRDVGY
jgi:hypothetical protein